MQLPLLHRSTQMAMLKKLIRRKVRELRWRRRRAKLRLKKIRQFRWELLRLMQRLIDLRQRDAEQGRREQARRAVGGMLQMYKRWLGIWTRSIESQSRAIRQEEQLKRGLNRRLRLLRKRLRKHKTKHLVDRCFKNLAKAVKRWQQRPDYRQYIESQELIFAQEIEEVHRYLSDIRAKSPKRRKAARRRPSHHIELPDFNSFWKSEVQKKEIQHPKKVSKIQAPRQEIQPEWKVYCVPKPRKGENTPLSSEILLKLEDLNEDQKRRRRRISTRKPSEKDLLGPSLKEMQKLFRLLKDINPEEQRIGASHTRNPKTNRSLKRKPAKTDLYQELEKTINNTKQKPPTQRKRNNRYQVDFIVNRMRSIGSALNSKIPKTRGASIMKAKKHKWPAMTTFRRKIPIRHKYVDLNKSMKLSIAPKFKSVNKKNRKKIKALKKSQRRRDLMESKNLWDSSDLSVSPSYIEKQRKLKFKLVNKKNIKESKAKARTPRKPMKNKKLWDSSDLSVPPSYMEKQRNQKFDLVNKKNIKERNAKARTPRKSMENKKIWDSAEFLTPPSQKLTGKPKSKLVVNKSRKGMDALKEDHRPRDSKENKKSNPSHSQKLAKKPKSKGLDDKNTKEILANSKSESHSPSETGTDIMKNKLINRKQLSETILTNKTEVRDSITSLTESLKNLIIESGIGRKSFRKSVFGWGLFPPVKKPKSRRTSQFPESSYQNLKRKSNTDSLSNQSRKSIRLPNRPVLSAPSVPAKQWSREESRIRSRNKGRKKFGFKPDHQADKQEVNEIADTIGYPTGQGKEYAFDDQAINNTDFKTIYPPAFTASDDTYDQEINKVPYTEIESKNGQDRNQVDPELGGYVVFDSNNETIDKDKKKTRRKPVQLKTNNQGNEQDEDRTLDHEESRYSKNINSDLLPHNFRSSNSRTGTLTDADTISGLQSHHKPGSVYKGNSMHSAVSSKFNIKDLNSDSKYRQVQYFLKDVIESNYILNRTPDIEGLMKSVGNHYMWDNIKDFYTELVAGGIDKQDVKRLLTDKYLSFLKTIEVGQNSASDNMDSSRRVSESESKREYAHKELHNLKFWYRQRMNTLPFRFGMQGIPNGKNEGQTRRNTEDINSSMYKKLLMQELKAERAKKDNWDERLRRLLPTTETSASMSFVSTNTMGEVEPEEEEDLRTIDKRYSLTNLNKMMDEHKARFQAVERRRIKEKEIQEKVDPAKKPPSLSCKKADKRVLRPIHQLYYSPRKTCRVQKAIKLYSEYSEAEQVEALEKGNEDQNVCTEKCPKCGVLVPVPCCLPSSKASSVILSSGSIEACARNELLFKTMANVCPRCGYIHDKSKPCSQPAEDRGKATILRLIKAVQAVRSAKCTESCSCLKIFKWQENDLRSCTSKLRQVESIAWRCPGVDEGGGDR